MAENSPVLSPQLATALIRGLSGSPGYPFHAEGESRAAAVLMDCSISVEHARAIIEEFEADFPSLEQLRSTAYRLRVKFDPKAKEEEAATRERERQERNALKGLRESVPLIPGVRWEICLQIQCLRIAVSEAFKDQAYYMQCCKEYPEAMADIREKRDPDPAIVERRYLALHPGIFIPKGMGALKALEAVTREVIHDEVDAERAAIQGE